MAPNGETRIQLCGRLVVKLEGRRVDDARPGALGHLLFAYLVLNRLRRIDRAELLVAVCGEEARASVTRQSDDALIHPARKSSSNSVGVLNVVPRAWSVVCPRRTPSPSRRSRCG
jgi:hypothetical protein